MAQSLVSLVEAHRLLAAEGVEISYITLKRRSQAGELDGARAGRKYDLGRLRQALGASRARQQQRRRARTVVTEVTSDAPARQSMEEGLVAALSELRDVRDLLAVLRPELRRLAGAVDDLQSTRRFLMVRDDEARAGLRERLETANAQIAALRSSQADRVDMMRIQSMLGRLAGAVDGLMQKGKEESGDV